MDFLLILTPYNPIEKILRFQQCLFITYFLIALIKNAREVISADSDVIISGSLLIMSEVIIHLFDD